MDLHHIRENYCKQTLSQQQCAPNPLHQFEKWLKDAIHAQLPEPTAMNIATINSDGTPSSRMVLLKEVNSQGFVFFTNYLSQKGKALQQHPVAALHFFWAGLERQVRIEGRVEKLSAEQSDHYFASRPYTSKIGAWASEQSAVIQSKNQLLAKAAQIAARYPLHIPRPTHWGGYLVIPTMLEFWQGRPSRLHDRIRYRLQTDGEWQREGLSP